MAGYRIRELSYVGGEKYKETVSLDNGHVVSLRISDQCSSKYEHSDSEHLDQNFNLVSTKTYVNGETKIKYYRPSSDIYKLIAGNESEKGIDLSRYDLSPNVPLWVGIGEYDNEPDNYDIFFAVNTDSELLSISKYYSLKYPLMNGDSIETDKGQWHSTDFSWMVGNVGVNCQSNFHNEFKIGSIKFKNNIPKLLKMYKSSFEDKEYDKRNK